MKRREIKPLVVIAVPILRVSARVLLEKGRGWSAVDELILWALARQPRSASVLATEIDLPRKVVLEVIFRMMRFRLVEVVLDHGVPAFRATAYGAGIVSGGEEIPALRQRISRKVAFVVDRITGTVFAKRDIRVENTIGLQAFRDAGADVRDVRVTGMSPRTNPVENVARFQKVLNADETLVHFDGDTLIEREDEFMVVTVDGGDLRGLPGTAPAPLIEQVHRIAAMKGTDRPLSVPSLIQVAAEPVLPVMVHAQFEPENDFIVGGPAHQHALLEALGTARRRFIVHSTFLKLERFDALSGVMRAAVRRGVRIDVFWGAGSPDEPQEASFAAAMAISKSIAQDDVLRGKVRVHLRSTGSHAKLLLSDDGSDGWRAIVGSCNWFFSRFDRLEMSARLKGTSAVAEVIDRMCRLVAKPGFRPEVCSELHLLAGRLRSSPDQTGNCALGIVVGPMHEALLREASGGGGERFLLASDRLGNAAFANAIVPAEVFASRTGIVPLVVYGQTSGAVLAPGAAADVAREAERRGIRLIAMAEGFHAKFMLWGDDDVVITSLNWGSATTSHDQIDSEIGVHLKGPKFAKILHDHMSTIWPLLNEVSISTNPHIAVGTQVGAV